MGFNVGKMNREGQIAAINQDVFQDIQMLTAGWDAIGGKVYYAGQCSKAVGDHLYRSRQEAIELVYADQDEVSCHNSEQLSSVCICS